MSSSAPGPNAFAALGRYVLRLFAVCAAVVLSPPGVAAPGDLEAKIKAAYVFHVIKFVDWPTLPNDAVTLCVSGSDGVTVLLSDLAGKQVKDRTLKVDTDGNFDPSQCQVLFVGRSDRKWQDIVARVRSFNVLTISDQEGFARGGGIVGLYPDGGKIRLEINPDAARSANLRISAKLLELARTVP